ncbi:MAG: BtpA/SgcQ family protein [Planctomycetes bacterium]|nr:BtpA/SgcQ family protein [Planctomycetota bacterium]
MTVRRRSMSGGRDGRMLLGVVHLRPLPSACGHRSMGEVLDAAVADAEAYRRGGVDGLVVENFGDAPFHRGNRADPVPPDVPAALALAAQVAHEATGLPLAINCLRNDGMAALGVAAVVGARWIRVNVLTGAYVTDQGLVEGEAARLFAYRKQLGSATEVLADLRVKHASPLGTFDLVTAAKDLAERSGAAGLVLSGSRTGESVAVRELDLVRAAVGRFPIWIGSGLTVDNAAELWPRCDGAFVGTSCKRGGAVGEPVDVARVRALRRACRSQAR